MSNTKNHRHFIMHKPFGYLCQFVCELPKKKLIGELYDFPEGTMAIGRLDEESEGLLFLTTDGMMSEIIRSRHIEKEYYAQVDGLITNEAIEKLKAGVEIGIRNVKYTTQPCKAFRLETPPDFPPRIRKIRDDRHGPTSWGINYTNRRQRTTGTQNDSSCWLPYPSPAPYPHRKHFIRQSGSRKTY